MRRPMLRFYEIEARSLTCVRRKLLPDGSRKPASIPYGRSSGVSLNSTPRAFSSSYEAWQSSVVRKTAPATPRDIVSRIIPTLSPPTTRGARARAAGAPGRAAGPGGGGGEPAEVPHFRERDVGADLPAELL